MQNQPTTAAHHGTCVNPQLREDENREIYLSFVSEKGISHVSDMFLLVVVIDLISKLYIYALYTLFWHGLASAIYILSRFYL